MKQRLGPTFLSTILVAFGTAFVFLAAAVCAQAQCPSPEKIAEGSRNFAPEGLQVTKVEPTPIAGICQAVVKVKGRDRLLYTDSKGDFIIIGQIIEAASGRNLTREADQALNQFSADDLKRLDALTAFTVGTADKFLYLVTDPQCPYCKKAEEALQKMAEKGELSVKFLLFPLASHAGAKEQSIAVICDRKGLPGLHEGYRSENQCEEGTKKVDETLAFLSQKGISGTPTYIFADGRYHPGLMQENQLRQLLGLPPAENPQPAAPPAETPPAAPKKEP